MTTVTLTMSLTVRDSWLPQRTPVADGRPLHMHAETESIGGVPYHEKEGELLR
jgi:hypothetical protein